MGKNYYVLIGDIINSKNISERNLFQNKLKDLLAQINDRYNKVIESKFSITLGDEFQAILNSADKIFEIIFNIELNLYPVKVRFALSYGQIDTEINKDLPLGSDGPAWWQARKILKEIKEKNERGLKGRTNIKFAGLNKDFSNIFNSTFSVIFNIKNRWTINQIKIIKEIINSYGITGDIKQADIANQLNITPSELNKSLKSSSYLDIANLLKNIENIIISEEKKND